MIERRVDERGKRRHGEKPHDGKAHRFSALEIDVIHQRAGQRNRKIDRVHEAHGEQEDKRKIQKIDRRMIAGKGVFVSHSLPVA